MMIWLLLLLTEPFNRDGLYHLPDWAAEHAVAMNTQEAPAGASVWCLLNEHLLGFDKDGHLIVRHRVVYAVLDQGGAEAAAVYAQGFSHDVGSLQRIKGWHLPRIGTLQTADQSDQITFGASSAGLINTQAVSATGFDFVGKGSVLAYESVKTEKNYLGAVGHYPLLAPYPTKTFHIRLVEESGKGQHVRLIAKGLREWGLQAKQAPNELFVYQLPAKESLHLSAPYPDFYPLVTAQFLATEEDRNRYKDWDHYARWYHGLFEEAALDQPVKPHTTVEQQTIQHMQQPLREQVTYQQVYLSNARGYVPAKGSEVIRRAYGDCKDMVACFAHMGQQAQVKVLPVLANIIDGPFLTGDMHPYPLFNHLIAAVPLQGSLGLPAEVETPKGRFLLYDPTAADTAFGFMPRGYLGRSVMICTEEGAVWVAVPEQALETGGLKHHLSGDLDADLHFKGKLTLTETGNAADYRTLVKRHGRKVTTRYFRKQLPPMARLTLIDAQVAEDGTTRISWWLDCPEFLKPNGKGYSLPSWIMPHMDTSLRSGGRPRKMPIFIEETPPQEWQLQLNSALPFKPAASSAEAQGDFWQYQWKAEVGDSLSLRFAMHFNRALWRTQHVAEGIQTWRRFSTSYHRFRLEQARLLPHGR